MATDNKIFAVLTEDRHTDVQVDLFEDRDDAIAFAKEVATRNARHPDRVEVETHEWCIMYINYSIEGDCVTVLECDVKKRGSRGS